MNTFFTSSRHRRTVKRSQRKLMRRIDLGLVRFLNAVAVHTAEMNRAHSNKTPARAMARIFKVASDQLAMDVMMRKYGEKSRNN